MDIPLSDHIQLRVLLLLLAAVGMPAVAGLGIYLRRVHRLSWQTRPAPPSLRKRIGMVAVGLVGVVWFTVGMGLAVQVWRGATTFWELRTTDIADLHIYRWEAPEPIETALAAPPVTTVYEAGVIAEGLSLLQDAASYERQRSPAELMQSGYVIAIRGRPEPLNDGETLYLRVITRTSRNAEPKAIVEPFTQPSMRTSLGLYEDEDFAQWLMQMVPAHAEARSPTRPDAGAVDDSSVEQSDDSMAPTSDP